MYFHFCCNEYFEIRGVSFMFFGSFSRNNTPFLRDESLKTSHHIAHMLEEHFVIYASKMQTLKLALYYYGVDCLLHISK